MAIRSKEELLRSINGIVGDNTSDEVLSFLDDMTDTLVDYEERTHGENWKEKYEENDRQWKEKYNEKDNEWRNRYKERFMGNDGNEPNDDIVDDVPEDKEDVIIDTFEQLFTVRED